MVQWHCVRHSRRSHYRIKSFGKKYFSKVCLFYTRTKEQKKLPKHQKSCFIFECVRSCDIMPPDISHEKATIPNAVISICCLNMPEWGNLLSIFRCGATKRIWMQMTNLISVFPSSPPPFLHLNASFRENISKSGWTYINKQWHWLLSYRKYTIDVVIVDFKIQ